MPASKNSGNSPSSNWTSPAAVVLQVAVLTTALGLSAALWSWSRGYTLYDGDAEAHLNIARRILDSRTPGPEQIGTGWLPLPHLLMLPFAMNDSWWQSGLAGAIPSALYFAAAGTFLFAAARRAFNSTAVALAAALLFALNPNALYLGSVPMTEMLFAASLAALLWATLWYRDEPSIAAVLAAAAASNAASLTRYEGWFLIPFVALYLLMVARRKSHAVLFAALATLGPLAWLAHNQYYYSDALEFYSGPWSAAANHRREIAQGVVVPTDHNWRASLYYYVEAGRLVAGRPLAWLAIVGAIVAVFRRIWWPLVFLLLCPLFYVISLHSAGADLYVPTFWPFTSYNTRYALPALVFAAFSAAGLAALVPKRIRVMAIAALVGIATLPWVTTADSPSICWKEAQVNSEARREAEHLAAVYLAANYKLGTGILVPIGELSGVLREAGIHIREALHEGNHPAWDAATARPGLFLTVGWAIANSGDDASKTIAKAVAQGRIYRLKKQVIVKGAPVVEIYHLDSLEDPVRKSPRRP